MVLITVEISASVPKPPGMIDRDREWSTPVGRRSDPASRLRHPAEAGDDADEPGVKLEAFGYPYYRDG